jgi:hypothetical protein
MSWQTPKTDWKSSDNPGPGDFNRIEGNMLVVRKVLFTTSGIFVVPDGITKVLISMVGGGGGSRTVSAGSEETGYTITYYAGGSGVWVMNREITVTPGESITVTIGAGSTTNGDASSFGSYYTCNGGGHGGGGNFTWPTGSGSSSPPGVVAGQGNPFGAGCLGVGNGYGVGGGIGSGTSGGTNGMCLIEW